MSEENDKVPAAPAADKQRPLQTLDVVREKLSGIEWEMVRDHFDTLREKAITQAQAEAEEKFDHLLEISVQQAIDDHVAEMKKANIIMPASTDAIDFFHRLVVRRLESEDYPETSEREIVLTMINAIR